MTYYEFKKILSNHNQEKVYDTIKLQLHLCHKTIDDVESIAFTYDDIIITFKEPMIREPVQGITVKRYVSKHTN